MTGTTPKGPLASCAMLGCLAADPGYVSRIHLVTKDSIAFDGGPDNVFDPDNGYRDAYRAT